MKKVILVLSMLGLLSSAEAGMMNCQVPVYKSVPIYTKVVKNIPRQECWSEERVTPSYQNSSFSSLPSAERIVSTRCTTTKCRTTYDRVEELVLTGYRNYARYGCDVITKVSSCPLSQIPTTVNY
jgi:hypothetical protein